MWVNRNLSNRSAVYFRNLNNLIEGAYKNLSYISLYRRMIRIFVFIFFERIYDKAERE